MKEEFAWGILIVCVNVSAQLLVDDKFMIFEVDPLSLEDTEGFSHSNVVMLLIPYKKGVLLPVTISKNEKWVQS